jgi:hypothetical protein
MQQWPLLVAASGKRRLNCIRRLLRAARTFPRRAMATLLSLPHELLLRIFKHAVESSQPIM